MDTDDPDAGRPIYATSYCNCGHYMDTGDAVDPDHDECWVHPVMLYAERDYGANAAMAAETALATQFDGPDDDMEALWDTVVVWMDDNGYTKENPDDDPVSFA